MVDDKEIWDVLGKQRPNIFTMVQMTAEEFLDKILWGGGLGFTQVVLNSTEVKEFLEIDQSFDLVISEHFFHEATFIFAHKYKAPLVLATTYGNSMRHNIVTRNPLQLATVISEYLDINDPTGFWGRLRNFYFTYYEFFWWKFWYLEKQELLVKKYLSNLPQPVPSLYELQKNAALMLYNNHFSFDPPTPYLPNVKQVAGLHLSKSDGRLPKDLQTILDNAKHGVVYVSFGSNIRSSELPVDKQNAFVNVFKRLKHTVIWKWEADNMANKPDNLVIRKWLPQKEILSHPNIKVFISHGGLIGTEEAIFNGVPIVGIPIYADQYNNMVQIQDIGVGKMLQYHDIKEKNLENILHEVLTDGSYKNKALEVSIRFKDRPMNALDTAIFWIEYVIRNKGADYMRNPARELSWIAYNMLDVYAFIFFAVLLFIFVVVKVVTALIRLGERNKVYKDLTKKIK